MLFYILISLLFPICCVGMFLRILHASFHISFLVLQNTSPTVDGMLGGLAFVSPVDIQGSNDFICEFFEVTIGYTYIVCLPNHEFCKKLNVKYLHFSRIIVAFSRKTRH